jgi:hypothetical protein
MSNAQDPNRPFHPHVLIISDGESEHEFELTGGPVDSYSNRAIVADIGRALLAWARMEQHLNLLIPTVNREHYSQDLYDIDHPAMFKRKLKLLKTWFNNHPPLLERRDDFRKLSGQLLRLAKVRNTIAHGILESINRRTQTAVFKSVESKENSRFKVHRVEIQLELFPRLARMSNLANIYLTDLTHRLCCEDGEQLLRLRE